MLRRRGINLDVNLFASAITLRPFQVEKKDTTSLEAAKDAKPKTDYEFQVELKERIRNMLENEQKIPRELIFVGRAQRITQSLNQVGRAFLRIGVFDAVLRFSCGRCGRSSALPRQD
jgi:aarF domain-containing kinase